MAQTAKKAGSKGVAGGQKTTPVSHYASFWEIRFKQLEELKNEIGDCTVPRNQQTLCRWADNQRAFYKKDELSKERVERLKSIGFQWSVRADPFTNWETRFHQLADWKEESGDCTIPRDQQKLCRWADRQRALYKEDKVSKERAERLESIGFQWSVRAEPVTWETRFKQLEKRKNEIGDCTIPRDQQKLCRWADRQRALYKKDKVSKERVERLKSIGFQWSVRAEPVTWETRFQQLADWKEESGDCNVPRRQGPLGKWVCDQRALYKKDKVSKERVERLKSIGFQWSGRAEVVVSVKTEDYMKYCADKDD